jgi:DNA-binding XRE family transcriptional regulator
MPKNAFARALSTKQKELKLSASGLAKAIGVGVQSVTDALKGTSAPNATTAAKYAAFLGVEVDALRAMAGKGAKAAGKAGRPAKTKAAKPAKAGKPGRKPKAAAPQQVDLTKVTIGQVAALLSDDLTLAVYEASAAKRDIIAAILRS